jgi:peptidoglycan/LPS O-acetylase OafA/YrhL
VTVGKRYTLIAAPAAAVVSKPHFEILDGLRGVAAIAVVAFHFFEAHSGGNVFKQVLNHGYLAVDFFFMLSGFVIGYAYDDRWPRMSTWDFLRRRLVRLQPMVVFGGAVGALTYYFQASGAFPMIATVPVWKLLLVLLACVLMIPLAPSISSTMRGWGDTYPLNSPTWSLFFEYIANIFYALVLRRVNSKMLGVITLLSGGLTLHYLFSEPRADLIGGWELNLSQMRIGFTRLLFPFLAGLLLFRLRWLPRIRQGFWVSSLVLFALLAWPRLGTPSAMWPNAAYEALCVLVLFPLIVAGGAGSELEGSLSRAICGFLGRISYPIYVVHYPFVYLYFALLSKGHGGLGTAAALFAAIVILSYAALRCYDEPLRAWLARRAALAPRTTGVKRFPRLDLEESR